MQEVHTQLLEDDPNYQEAHKDLRCNPDAKEAQRRHNDSEVRQCKVGFLIPRGFQFACTNGFVYSVFYDVWLHFYVN